MPGSPQEVPMSLHPKAGLRVLLVAVVMLSTSSACGDDSKARAAQGTQEAKGTTLRLGYFPNLTHATALVGVESGIFSKALGSDRLKTTPFNAGPSAIEAIFSGAIDATYIGPNPAVNAFVRSKGKAIRIVA